MTPAELTPDTARDLRLLRLRRYASATQFFKSDDFRGKRGALPTTFQLGRVLGGISHATDAPLTRRQRKRSLALEFLADEETKKYARRVFRQTQEKSHSGGKKAYAAKMSRRVKNKGRGALAAAGRGQQYS